MRKRFIFAVTCLIVLTSLFATPLFWQWVYRDRLAHAVPIGATRNDYMRALLQGKLGQGMPRPGFTFWRPFEAHGFAYTIVALPEWDAREHLVGYRLFPKISLRGHAYYLVRPQGTDIRGLL